ncbi:MAG: glycoside hydrolase family 3 N-terminal domain-containing protein, partial [Desulfovibrionaceae bacterium]|nr:glycoside hydrolase family 3 N-terminal domain-containing protein [Desulfovibrionaceae bacterium]
MLRADRFRLWLIGLVGMVLLAGSFAVEQPGAAEKDDPSGQAASPPSLERMVGAMLMLGFRGMELTPDDPFLAEVRSGRVGHVILFDRDMQTGGERNIRSPEQVRRLTATLREAAPGPIFIAVDQEGGQVRRLKPEKGFMDLPSAQRMGQENLTSTTNIAAELGRELAGLGINVDMAPVADVNVNPFSPAIGQLGRSFNTDPRQVARHVLAFGRELARAGVAPVLKHFPGHGSAKADSHLGLTDISRTWDGGNELLPYAEAFAAGWSGMVMTGHLFHAGLDAQHPATLSKMVVTGLLRQGLGWQGVVISDDMQMQAISDSYGLEESIYLAVEAGVDILLFGNNLTWDADLPRKAHATLLRLVESGRISPERIRRSWERIS